MHVDETRGLIREPRSFRVHRSGNQAIGGAGTTLIVFNAAQYDPYGLVNLTTGKVTLPAGVWLIGASVYAIGAYPNAAVIYKDGTAQAIGAYGPVSGAGPADSSVGVSDVVTSDGTNVVDIRAIFTAASSVTGSTDHTYFYGVKVG